MNIAVMASGGGSNFEALAQNVENGYIPGKITLLIYDRRDAYVKERAKNHGIEAVYLNKYMFDKDEDRLDSALLALLQEKHIDLVVLAGYLSKVGDKTVTAYKNRIINTHPALIPSFCGDGMHGSHVHRAVVDYGVKLSGATMHFIDGGMDSGPVILQEACPVTFEDTPEDVAARVLEIEHRLLPLAVKLFCEGRLEVIGRRVKIKD